jgi:hypothetical protein
LGFLMMTYHIIALFQNCLTLILNEILDINLWISWGLLETVFGLDRLDGLDGLQVPIAVLVLGDANVLIAPVPVQVFALLRGNDPDLLLKLLRAITEFFRQPGGHVIDGSSLGGS